MKKSYYQPGSVGSQQDLASIAASVLGRGRTVSNEWVSDTPSEFRKKLAEAFNLASMKSTILHRASVTKPTGKRSDDEPLVNLEEN